MNIRENITLLDTKIQNACYRSGRSREDITVIAVSKTKPVSMIKEVLINSNYHIGENYVQEALKKQNDVLENNACRPWHFIGSLQTNKVKQVVGRFEYIHSLDRLNLAEAVNQQANKLQIVQKCLLELNIEEEKSKTGIRLKDSYDFLNQLNHFQYIQVCGLMAIPPEPIDANNIEKERSYFKLLNELLNELNEKQLYQIPLTELSMGMSRDFEIAIEEGATMIRIGTFLFGDRS